VNTLKTGSAIALHLRSAEQALDVAMIETSTLVRAMLEARADLRLAAETGNAELADVVASLGDLSTARTRVVQTHKGLADLASELRIGWKMEGPLERKMEPTGHLTVVPAVA
jgi:hypothetical protein